jgi:gluconokinase/shikimate kinase
MPLSLLESQFAALEEPTPDEPMIRIDVGAAPTDLADQVMDQLGLQHRTEKV